ncbi:MAG: leukotoxin LktA family filamentous adhesin, partial [Treponema sp.]|nr:leukotoxin LktA family filamentous adhesin [Treponema sp.]
MNAPVALFADEFITGVDPSGNTYNIVAEKVSGDTGFRHYDNFSLQNDYVANLIYRDSYSKFVNLVDSQITINGIVNTMKGGNFYNGHAIFVSPNGMVVGSSGFLNVGSLSVLTPSQGKFDDFVSAYGAGSLSPYVVGGDSYKALITDSHGNIVINGKILSRGDVNLFGDTIAIQGLDGNKAGIVAGWQDSNTSFSDLQSAKNTFDSLVSNNITDATNFALKDGKIKIVAGYKELDENNKPDGIAKKAEVYIKNAQIGASEVEVKANSTREYDTFDVFDSNNDGKHYDLADADDAISSKITIKDSSVAGESVDIAATSQAALSRDINMSIPTVFWWLFDGDDAKIADFFDGGIYDGFEGARTSAVIDIVDSAIQATKNDLSITSSAISNTSISSTIGEVIPHIFYGYGTKTESKINIKNSSLKAKNDVVLNALSQNVMNAAIANNGTVSIQAENAYDFAFASNSTSADTKITIDHSTVEGHDVSALALAYNKLKNKVDLRALIGANDFAKYGQNGQEGQGGSGAVADVLMNDTDIQSAVEVLNGSSVTASNDVTLNAYNINEVNNNVTSKTLDPTGYQKRYEDPDGWWHKFLNKTRVLGGEIKQWTNFSFGEMRNLFSNKINNTKNIWNHSIDDGLDKKASFQVGAGALFNNSKTTNNVIINNSTINAGKDINIKAHTVDLTANVAAALAKQADAAKVGGAFSFSLNDQQNDNKVDIIDSIIKTSGSGSTINVDSIVELPSQQGTLGVSMKFPEVVAKGMNKAGYWIGKSVGINTYDDEDWKGDLTLSMDFNFGAQDNLGFGFHTPDQDAPASGLIPDIGIFGFFNNFAIASAAGEKVGLSGAVAINNIENNSDINVTDSTIEKVDALAKNGGIYMNSVVSASVHDAIDFVGSVSILLVSSLKDWQNASGATAIGGSVLVQNFNNNARTTVDNSAIDAKGGNLELNSAAEQAYLNLLTPGGKANTVGVVGAIGVQSIKGTTSSTVKGNSTLNAGNISVSSGKAKAALSKKNTDIAEDSIHLLDDEGKFSLGEAREVKDHVTTAAFDGSLVTQSQSGQDPSSFGVAVGASVIVKTIDRTVKTSIVDSVLTANKKIDVASTSYNKDFIVTVAAAHVGGVSTDRARQEQANQNANNDNQNPQAEDQPQEMQDVGNWMNIM